MANVCGQVFGLQTCGCMCEYLIILLNIVNIFDQWYDRI